MIFIEQGFNFDQYEVTIFGANRTVENCVSTIDFNDPSLYNYVTYSYPN